MTAIEQSFEVAGFAMAHAAWIASDLIADDMISPIVIVMRGGERHVIPFEADTQIEAVNAGKASFDELKHTVDSWAFVMEGLYSVAGSISKTDVLVVSAWVRSLDEPVILQQMFCPPSKGEFHLLGELILTVHGVQVPSEAHDRLWAFVIQGIQRHPHGQRWAEWVVGTVQ